MQWLRRLGIGLTAVMLSLCAGCASRITNLTPSLVPREASGLYHFEVEWTSNERARALRQDAISAYVVLGQKFYPMERVPRMNDRWETEAPVPSDANPVFYYFKWEYRTAEFGYDAPNSIRSKEYRLEISDAPL